MRKLVNSFLGRVPELDHEERVSVSHALESIDDFKKVCYLIESKQDEHPHCPHSGETRIHKHRIRSGKTSYERTHRKII